MVRSVSSPRFWHEGDHQSVTVGATANRIGAKFDELMALRDGMGEQLTTSQSESQRLLEAKLGMGSFTITEPARLCSLVCLRPCQICYTLT